MKILIADDHGIVRGGLKLLIDRQPDMEVVAEAADGVEAFERALQSKPDLCVLDVSMPRMTGLQAAREIRARCPDTHVLLLSMHDDERYVFDALKAGASGYVLKRQADAELIEAVRAVASGGRFLSATADAGAMQDWIDSGSDAPHDPLTPRELDVVKLIAEAYSSKEIAKELVISVKTVERHRQNILDKLGMSDRVELTRYAIRRGLIQP